MKLLKEIVIMTLCVVFGIVIHGSVTAWNESYEESKQPEPVVEYVYIESEPEVITEYIPYEEPFYRNFTEEDKDLLCDMAMREAEGEDAIGQAMVMYVVLNRAEAYGQTIKQVCESDAFKSSRSRSGKTPNEECLKALALVEEGWTPKPLWFRAGHYHNFGTPLYQVNNHYFSGK